MPYTIQGVGYQRTDTSEAAAPDKPEPLRILVLGEITKSPYPLSANDIARLLQRPYVSVQPRLSELKNAGKIEDSGKRDLTPFGKKQILWRIRQVRPRAKPQREMNL